MHTVEVFKRRFFLLARFFYVCVRAVGLFAAQ